MAKVKPKTKSSKSEIAAQIKKAAIMAKAIILSTAAAKKQIKKQKQAKTATIVKAKAKQVKKSKVTKKITKKPTPKPTKKVVPPAKKQIPEKKQKVEKKETKKEKKDTTKVLKPVKAKSDTPTVPVKFKAYSIDQYQKYLQTIQEWSKKTNQEIKNALRANQQSMSGNKDEILAKLADGVVLGQIPRCANCFGGRPKFNQSTGVYFCVGYRDDTDFKWCNTSTKDIVRVPWVI